MNRCTLCGVDILDQTEICPLCQCVVREGAAEQAGERYPDIRLKGRKMELIARIVLFFSIMGGALCVIINLMQQTQLWWSAVSSRRSGLSAVNYALFVENEHAGYLSKIIIGTACGIAYVGATIDYVFGFTRWSLNYAVPAAFLAIDMMTIVFMFVNMRNWQSYLLLQIFMILCSGVCVVLFLAGIVTEPGMSYAAFGCSCMMFLATFIIGGRRAVNELKRRFHVM